MHKKMLIYFLTLATIVSGYGCSTSTQKEESVDTRQEKSESSDNKKGEKLDSLLINPDTFQKQFNDAALKLNSSYTLPQLQVENGQVFDVFSYNFNNGFSIIGSVNKSDNTIRELSLHLDPNKSNEEFLPRMKTNYILSKIMIYSVTPDISENELQTILTNLNLFEDEFTPYDKPGYYRTDKVYYERKGPLFYIIDARPNSKS
ncbi:hypothetical protein [Bacillus mycoides]|uniref:hypothetical protein n=1 Tax=Bacillus mycoides TaxID=1405 RepID=UPI000A27C596|nr:hypothetical protein [Bacillus mycoides]OSX97138.1 hypothetical protein BTJ44_00624 [Bacillus mycoides]